MTDAETISKTIVYLAGEQMKAGLFQHINNSIYTLCMEIELELMKIMLRNKNNS